ncbi:MAG: DUF1501 domain-containing protein [Acidobacteriota bacterium]|nr:DUF1501 domain-containing protein [Acidobacteriota bacterium]
MNRRYFIKSGGVFLASFGLMELAPSIWLKVVEASAKASDNGNKKILVAIFMRGGVDGLSLVAPYQESQYYEMRPNIAIPRPGKENGLINLDGYFGLHPALKNLEGLWREERLAIIHSVGLPNNTRSHFDAQDYMESATPGIKSTRDGWLNRILQIKKDASASYFSGVSFTREVPRSFMGGASTITITDLSDFSIRAGVFTRNVEGGFESVYQGLQSKDTLAKAGKEAFEAIDLLKKVNPSRFKPENGAVYPNVPLGRSLMQIAQLIKADIGLEIAFTDTPGMNWDTHANQGGANGQLANNLRIFAAAISAFFTDLGKRTEDVLILTMSEFGRTVRQNGSGGTDHGHGNLMFVIGGNVKGGKVYADWKGLRQSELYEGRDLAVTTDFRDVFGEIVYKHLKVKELNRVFPNYDCLKSKWRNFLP